jgi:nucleotide-binding universal stress UspA family protein
MEKMLVVIDPLKVNRNLLDFALDIGQQTKSAITGLFMERAFSDKLVEKDLHGFPVAFTENKTAKYRLSIKAEIEETLSDFERKCMDRRIPFVVHRDFGVPVDDVVAESRFADLMLIDAGNEPYKTSENTPTAFVREILRKSECPVILAPAHPGDIHEIIFCYDGSRNAMQAIRRFSNLFPQYKDKKLIILEVLKDEKEDRQADKRLKEWVGNHYCHFQHEIRKGTVRQILFDSVFKKENIFIVMGSFGRSALSILFKKATAESLIKLTTQPVFIAHD